MTRAVGWCREVEGRLNKLEAENRELRRADTAWQYSDIGKLKARLTEAERLVQMIVEEGEASCDWRDDADAFLNREDTHD